MKNLLFVLAYSFILISCSTSKKAQAPQNLGGIEISKYQKNGDEITVGIKVSGHGQLVTNNIELRYVAIDKTSDSTYSGTISVILRSKK